ncbi:hypothetical protein NDU88_000274 [Pleurodeles waltl]|uniref:Uncharacterized protein n=1 Tax=Pleurodeles waltl TaxID=8319 RepID=A0AAV7U321_PLEWA|nr:hypothetical protein NDU88_000274 [Pleurodeles waltl]
MEDHGSDANFYAEGNSSDSQIIFEAGIAEAVSLDGFFAAEPEPTLQLKVVVNANHHPKAVATQRSVSGAQLNDPWIGAA